jgi:hypothetical protein
VRRLAHGLEAMLEARFESTQTQQLAQSHCEDLCVCVYELHVSATHRVETDSVCCVRACVRGA